jgi:SET domain-containing protein
MTTGDQGSEPGACWLHPHIQVLPSAIHGRGLFATQPLAAGTIVATLAGRLVSDEELHQLLAQAKASQRYLDTICVDDDAHLILPPGQPIHYGNHSCDPNLWHTDARTLATRRDVHAGEELTVDYATQTTSADFQMPCRCRALACRHVVTGNDWQISQWGDSYQGHVVPAVAKRIEASL